MDSITRLSPFPDNLCSEDIEQEAEGDTLLSTVPPYWQHRRYESYASANLVRPSPITLVDHTVDLSGYENLVWAESVIVSDYVIISGSLPSMKDYVVWNCKIGTLDVGLFLHLYSVAAPLFPQVLSMLSILPGWYDDNQEAVATRFNPSHCHNLILTRYSEFEDLRMKLLITFPFSKAAMPPLPPKSMMREWSVPLPSTSSVLI